MRLIRRGLVDTTNDASIFSGSKKIVHQSKDLELELLLLFNGERLRLNRRDVAWSGWRASRRVAFGH